MGRKYPVLRLRVVVGDQPGWLHHDRVPALDLVGPPGLGPYIARRWPDQSSCFLLLENMSAPAGDPGAGGHGGEHLLGNFGEIQNRGGLELDVRRERAVGSSLPEWCLSFALEHRRELVPRGSQVPSHIAQDSRARILCAIHVVTKAH